MGLDMYLFRMKKTQKTALDEIYKEICSLDDKWSDFNKSLPMKDDGLEADKEKMTDEQKTKLDLMKYEFKTVYQKEDEISNVVKEQYGMTESWGKVSYCGGWRKFNALHAYIVNEFGGGIDECQEINLTKYDLKHILLALEETKEILDNATKIVKKTEYGDREVYDVDNSTIPLPPQSGFFFGSTEIDKLYYEYVSSSIGLFKNLIEDLKDDEICFYKASW